MALVIVIEPREEPDEQRLVTALHRRSDLPVTWVNQHTVLEGGRVYACGANLIVTVDDGRLVTREAQPLQGTRSTLDSFLVSLAEVEGERAIAVMLHGSSGDGTLGIAAVKERGGLTLAEPHRDTGSDALAPTSSPAAIADVLLPPEEMPKAIDAHVQLLLFKDGAAKPHPEAAASHPAASASSDLRNFLEFTQTAAIFLDHDLRVMNFTPAVTDIFQLVEGDIGRPLTHIKSLLPLDELPQDVRKVLRTLANAERSLENPLTGGRYHVRTLPYRGVDNLIAGVVITFVDVMALTRAEERHRLLLSELQRRVRNTLGVVRSIARRTADSSETVRDFATHLDGRLNAFARVQSAVTRDPGSGLDLQNLISEELLAHAAHEGEQLAISGPTVRLQPKVAETFALAIHELATNSVKYGALSAPGGSIQVTWQMRPGAGRSSHLAFSWIESGVQLSHGAPARRGFGTELLERTLNYELQATTTLAYDATGLRCTILMPITHRVSMAPADA